MQIFKLPLLALALLFAFNSNASSSFVKIKNGAFFRENKSYRFLGINFWYGMYLGSTEFQADAHERLTRELDRISKLGMTNVRVMVTSEGPTNAPWRITPALSNQPSDIDDSLLKGLDFLMSELRKRNLTAVLVLNNFWQWSGGMAQYVNWSGFGEIPYPPPASGASWGEFQEYSALFYTSSLANTLWQKTISAIITRKNTVTGEKYANDSTILAWEIANEPRGGKQASTFNQWIDNTAKYIKTLDTNHLVTLGSEGNTPNPISAGNNFYQNHLSQAIDYTTVHIWPQNWGWYDTFLQTPDSLKESIQKSKSYLQEHLSISKILKKPLVLEEFGFPRDSGKLSAASPTTYRDQYFKAMFEYAVELMNKQEPITGVNVWAWSGEARPQSLYWSSGQPLLGDPPHEPQGWYSIYDSDISTSTLIKEFSSKIQDTSL